MIVSKTNELVQCAGNVRAWLIANAEKAPCDAHGHRLKGWNTDAALRTYAQAATAVRGAVRFTGLRMDAVPGLVALDLDNVLNDAGGHIDPVAAAIWGCWPSYTEITPSRRGLRIWWRVEPQPAEPVTVQARHNWELTVYDFATGQMRPRSFGFGRELYYRAMRFLISTGQPYLWYPDSPNSLAVISPDALASIAALVREKRVPTEAELALIEAHGAFVTAAGKPIHQQETKPAVCAYPYDEQRRRTIGGVLRWLAQQKPGNRNRATYWAAHRLREAGLTFEHAQSLLVPLSSALGLPERESARTVRSAFGG